MDANKRTGLAMAAGSGILYGSINVLAKPLEIHPFVKVAIAYLTSALVLSPFLRGLRIQRRDWWKVATMGLVGGGVAPALLFFGLQQTAAVDAGLLLNLELVATAVLAVLFLHERFHLREGAGLVLLLCVAVVVALAQGGAGQSTWRGLILVAGAGVAWGIDNTVSGNLVGTYEPRALIAVKGLIGGGAGLLAAIAVQAPTPALQPALAMAGLGIASIAVSSLLFYYALRRIGAARTSAMNTATTALIGAIGGALVLHEHLAWPYALAFALLLSGTLLLASAPPRPPPTLAPS